MYLSRLTPDTTSHRFRRDHGDLQHMHRTVMSAFPDIQTDKRARADHAVLWRLDPADRGFALYVQSRTRPDWNHLGDYLAQPADVRELSPVLDAVQPGRKLAFRLAANPTKRLRYEHQREPGRAGRRDNRYPIVKPEAQLAWLINQGDRNGFIIPAGSDAQPDVALVPGPRLTGRQAGSPKTNKVSVDPVRFDGHLVVTDAELLTAALTAGIGPAKAYGCGLLTLARARQS
ncbi:type I-E CRISPR-associated protein Cas6/Cse3/CasE [Saccharopolyspora gregorii]|uniref:Type I-E CRISPR-associated protein Cas6/Cse3/CasE n=1 Tax=Saccharopolyspora gregorii TaxID=33914 RepID=A0ABP6RND6_9PSEU